jgi:hypothetical protein
MMTSEAFYIALSILLLISLVASNAINKVILDKALTTTDLFIQEIEDLKKVISELQQQSSNSKNDKEGKKKK